MRLFHFWSVPIQTGTPVELALYVKRRLSPRRVFLAATPNPEIMLKSRRDALLKKILAQLAFNIPDGTGLVWALRRGLPREVKTEIRRVPGVEFMETLLAVLPAGQRVLCFGGEPRRVALAARRLSRQFPSHTFAALAGEIPEIRRLKKNAQNLVQFRAAGRLKRLIAKQRPTVIFAGLGSPRQEKWLAANLKTFPSVRLTMGVGGAFDMLAGFKPRAPGWFRRLGLEWLWRLAQEPKRLGRMFRAVVIFPYLVLAQTKLKNQNSKRQF